ncbi:MAG: cysteine desulfurase family protein, partial [Elusimicrobiota bacterium]
MKMQMPPLTPYLDNAATTAIDPEVIKAMDAFLSGNPGNASSPHGPGIYAAKEIERAREIIARHIGADADEIFFTSGGTESNNFAIKGIAWANKRKGNHLLISRIEHPSVLRAAEWLHTQGFEIDFLPVDSEGFVSREDTLKLIKKGTILVSVMHANNEVGTQEPIEKIGASCRERGIYFHTDACQSFTRLPLNVKDFNLDLVSLNAHKIHGPTGTGALYIRKGITMDPIFHGGGQENNLRAGTYNAAGIVGFAKAVEISLAEDIAKMTMLRDYFIDTIRTSLGGIRLNGPASLRLCNNINMVFPCDGNSLFHYLNKKNIAVSAGSACHSTRNTPSHVLLALGLSPDDAKQSLRLSLSKFTTKEEIDYTIAAIRNFIAHE